MSGDVTMSCMTTTTTSCISVASDREFLEWLLKMATKVGFADHRPPNITRLKLSTQRLSTAPLCHARYYDSIVSAFEGTRMPEFNIGLTAIVTRLVHESFFVFRFFFLGGGRRNVRF